MLLDTVALVAHHKFLKSLFFIKSRLYLLRFYRMKIFKVVILLVLLSCNHEKNTNTAKNNLAEYKSESKINQGYVSLIISNPLNNTPLSIIRSKNYNNTNENLTKIISKKNNDTISFKVHTLEKIFLTTKHHVRKEIILKPGDIIKVNIDDKSLHTNTTCETLHKKQNPKIAQLRKIFYEIDSTRPFKPHSTKYEKKAIVYPLKIHFGNFKTKETELLALVNSLIKENSEEKNKILNTSVNSRCKENSIQESNLTLFKELCLLYGYSKHEKLKEVITDLMSKTSLNDINLYVKANTFIKRVVLKNEKIKEKFKLKVGYEKAYDLISNYNSLDKNISSYLKLTCINQMIVQKDSKESILNIINEFEKQYPNSAFNPLLEKHKAQLSVNNKTYAEEVLLVNHKNNKTTLEKVLEKNKGKIIYIDLWASWCLPCRYKMIDLKKLKQYYSDKKVAFIYLSIDEYKNDWQQASIEEGLNNNTKSFLIQNFKSSKFLKNLKINSIPRYLLIDKNGKMINENAPGPDAKEIKETINEKLLQ
jgi:thiol-disulfide isomerase/thioredoxin